MGACQGCLVTVIFKRKIITKHKNQVSLQGSYPQIAGSKIIKKFKRTLGQATVKIYMTHEMCSVMYCNRLKFQSDNIDFPFIKVSSCDMFGYYGVLVF
jgi:hypothetical protein